MPTQPLYRADGVRITHDPYSPAMIAKYGAPGKTDNEGFDPYADSVGPGIYGGRVRRDENGQVVIGRQYQNHNTRPGPVYAGGGYAPSAAVLSGGTARVAALLDEFPELANDVTTGGAQPLHMCGMSRANQEAAKELILRGADVEALDTYGMTPLHRMASNNLALGARILLEAGAALNNPGKIGAGPEEIAKQSEAHDVLRVFREFQGDRDGTHAPIHGLQVIGAVGGGETEAVNGEYARQPASMIPAGFASVCKAQGWPARETWAKLQGGEEKQLPWFKHTENESYIYKNLADGRWWIDGPSGGGVFIAEASRYHAPPAHEWQPIAAGQALPPVLLAFRTVDAWR